MPQVAWAHDPSSVGGNLAYGPRILHLHEPRVRNTSVSPTLAPPSARLAVVMPDLAAKACVPCRGGTTPLKSQDVATSQRQVAGWNVIEGHHITKTFTFPNFRGTLNIRKPRRRARGGTGAPPRHLACLGKSRDYDLDAQNQWFDRERFHPGCKDRPVLQILVLPPRSGSSS